MGRDIEFRRAMIALKNDDLRSYDWLMRKWAAASALFKTEEDHETDEGTAEVAATKMAAE